MVQDAFTDQLVSVLCCTASLAWGENLPAHTVCIRGTRVYDQTRGEWTDLGILDVQQIFGRAEGDRSSLVNGRMIAATTASTALRFC